MGQQLPSMQRRRKIDTPSATLLDFEGDSEPLTGLSSKRVRIQAISTQGLGVGLCLVINGRQFLSGGPLVPESVWLPCGGLR